MHKRADEEISPIHPACSLSPALLFRVPSVLAAPNTGTEARSKERTAASLLSHLDVLWPRRMCTRVNSTLLRSRTLPVRGTTLALFRSSVNLNSAELSFFAANASCQ